jgi:thiol-disulfide isomerase/thioredoxin
VSLEPTALGLIQQVGDAVLWQKTAERLRGQLESRTERDQGPRNDALAIAAWPQLWQLESRLQPAAAQEQVRQRERADLARLRALNLTGIAVWYEVLQNGYAGLGDEEGRKWADAQMLQDLGSSPVAFGLLSAQWWQAHSTPTGRPLGDDTARSRELLSATGDWIARWPNHPTVWQSRFRAVAGLQDTPPAVVEQVATRLLELEDRSPDAVGGTVPPALDVARLFVERGIALDRVPGLIRKMDEQLNTSYEAQRKIQYGVWANPAYLERYRWTTHWDGMKVLFELHQKSGRKDAALEVLASLQQSVANVDAADRVSQAAGWPMVLEMALAAGRLETARAALARLEAFRSANQPAEGDPIQRAVSADNSYWEGAARIAEAEGRKLDAVSFYLNSDSPAGRAQAHRLWTGLGGTDRGWDAAVDRSGSKSAPPAGMPQTGAAQTRERVLPDFAVEDVSGKKVRLADLKGKTVLLNIWATWCAPCREELPQIEDLSRTLKGRTDVAVVTLNADENPGLVKPFLDRAGYSFPVLLASEYVWKTLGVAAIPQNWIVDQAGVVRMDLESLDRTTLAKQVLPLFDKLRLDKLRPVQ